MDVDWQKFGIKAYQGIKDVGATATISCTTYGAYDRTTGITAETTVTYASHAIVKQYLSENNQIINKESGTF